MKDKMMNKLKDVICRELEEISEKPTLSAGDIDIVYKLAVAKEKLLKAETLEEEEAGYSGYGGGYAGRMYRDNGMSGDGMQGDSMRGDSYGRHYVRGHYSRDDSYDDRMRR